MNAVRASILGVALLASGCFGSEVTEFPAGLAPLGDNALAGPGTTEDPYPESFQVEGMDGSRFSTILGRGYIHATPAQVYAAYQNPAVGADRRTSPEWTSEEASVDGTVYELEAVPQLALLVTGLSRWRGADSAIMQAMPASFISASMKDRITGSLVRTISIIVALLA